MQAAGTRH